MFLKNNMFAYAWIWNDGQVVDVMVRVLAT